MDIRGIARISGYSLGTVSRVLNDHPNVSDKARERVLEVVKEYGYEPNGNARHLKMQQKTSVTVFVKGTSNLLFADILEHVQSYLAAKNEGANVVYLDENENEVLRALRYRQSRNPKGMLFLGGQTAYFKQDFSAIDVPCVMVTSSAEDLDFPNLSSVSTNDFDAATEMIDALYGSGHRRIGIIGGNLDSGQVGYQRVKGATEALRSHGIEFDFNRDYEPCRYSMNDGYEALVRLMMRSPDLTAVFALSDVIALGIIRAVADLGRSVPDDLSVAGFDGIVLSQFSVPRLMTIRQDTTRLAETSVRILLDAIAGASCEPIHEYVPHYLFRRESVRELPIA